MLMLVNRNKETGWSVKKWLAGPGGALLGYQVHSDDRLNPLVKVCETYGEACAMIGKSQAEPEQPAKKSRKG